MDQSVDDPDNCRLRRRRGDAEMRVDDGPKFIGRDEAGNEILRRRGRSGDHDGVFVAERLRRAVELQGDRTRPLESKGLQPIAQARLSALRRKEGQRRIDEAPRQAARRDKRMAGVSASAEASRA